MLPVFFQSSENVGNMDIELARFNMIENQVRASEVLDPRVLDVLARIHRELGPADSAVCRRRGAAMTYEEAVDYVIVELDRISAVRAERDART